MTLPARPGSWLATTYGVGKAARVAQLLRASTRTAAGRRLGVVGRTHMTVAGHILSTSRASAAYDMPSRPTTTVDPG